MVPSGMIKGQLPTKERRIPESFVAQSRQIVADLMLPRPWIYWCDMLLSLVVAYTAASMYLSLPFGTAASFLSYIVGSLGIYRLSMFMHEIVHFRRGEMRSFQIAWNILAGIPMMLPSFFYDPHISHHNTQHYGTERDGEYLPLAKGVWHDLLLFLAQVFVQPLFFFFRFLIGTPLSFLNPRLRDWMLQRASSYAINFRSAREIRQHDLGWGWTLLEIACSLRAWALVLFVLSGLAPWTRLPKLFSLSFMALGINHFRTLAAHRYRSDGLPVSHEAQFLDSTNITGGWLTELICPLGLRYHALHHLFPAIPYHSLGMAHRRLINQLPANSIYRETVYRNFWEVLRELLAAIGANARQRQHLESQQ
jgi:fatty acid desaturase